MVEFDNLTTWRPSLSAALSSHVTTQHERAIAGTPSKYLEDARDHLLKLAPGVVNATANWLSGETIAVYHGSRLMTQEVSAIQRMGLIPLQAVSRRTRLERALESHPKWPEVKDKLENALRLFRNGGPAGNREGQVHASLSCAGLLCGFPHYLAYGSEFDYHVAFHLLGKEGADLLGLDGDPYVVRLAVPGDVAIKAAHPIFTFEDMQRREEIPNLVKEFIEFWAYSFVDPTMQPSKLKVDSCVRFSTVGPEWINAIDRVSVLPSGTFSL